MSRSVVSIALFAACSHNEPPANHAADVGPARSEGTIGHHHFAIAIAGAELVKQTPSLWRWRVPGGEITVSDSGAPTEATKFQVARSPRTIVRSDRGYHVITE